MPSFGSDKSTRSEASRSCASAPRKKSAKRAERVVHACGGSVAREEMMMEQCAAFEVDKVMAASSIMCGSAAPVQAAAAEM